MTSRPPSRAAVAPAVEGSRRDHPARGRRAAARAPGDPPPAGGRSTVPTTSSRSPTDWSRCTPPTRSASTSRPPPGWRPPTWPPWTGRSTRTGRWSATTRCGARSGCSGARTRGWPTTPRPSTSPPSSAASCSPSSRPVVSPTRRAGWSDARTAISDVLRAEGPLPARDVGRLVPEIAATEIPIERGVHPGHTRALLVMGFDGQVLRARPTGSWINGQYRWADAEAWVPGGLGPELSRREAAEGLARAYLRAFGPATRDDLRWWAGWTVATTKAALADTGAVEVALDDGGTGFVLPDDDDGTTSPTPARRSRCCPAWTPPRWAGRPATGTSTRRSPASCSTATATAGRPSGWTGGSRAGGSSARTARSPYGCSPTSAPRPASAVDAAAHDLSGAARRRPVLRALPGADAARAAGRPVTVPAPPGRAGRPRRPARGLDRGTGARRPVRPVPVRPPDGRVPAADRPHEPGRRCSAPTTGGTRCGA